MDFYFASNFQNCGLVRKWNFLGFILTFLLLENVLCENAWEIPNNDLVDIQEEVQKISIIGYNKAKMTTDEIEKEKIRIQNECHCSVENLASVGAFILNYDKTFHPAASTLNLDHSTEIGVEDQIVTIFNEEIPTDPYFNAQWALQDLPNDADINAAEGWREYISDFNGGDSNGPSVVVAVIDTGVDYNHLDLKDVMWNNPGEIPANGKDDDGNGLIDDVYGADFNSPPNGDPIDRHSHGTHCAGIIAAKENNQEGIAGVASFAQGKVKIMAVKGLSDAGAGYLSNLLKSLNYAIQNGATVSSNSWGGGSIDDATEQLWKMVLENNPEHLFIAAAGNSNKFLNDNYKIMACGLKLANLLCVASSTQQDKKSGFSNYGKDYVHVFAPGSNIYSTIPNNRYAYKSGTSMACPHVSGLAALIRTMRPDMNAQQVRDVIEANVQKKAAYENVVSSGGIIDMEKSIRNVKDKICNTVNEGKQLNVKCPSSQKIYIGSALYGKQDIGCSASTSLSKVKALCQGKKSCDVPANNHVFGDPCYGVRKFLTICSSCADQICNTVNEGKQLNVKCPSSQKINVGSALYGKEDRGCSASTSLSKVKALCQGKNSCNVPANNHVFGDPCYGVRKFLTICSSCDDKICNTVNEGKQLNVKCPSSQRINIGSALYGKEDIGCLASTSLSKVNLFCQGKNRCNVPANNHVFGDPCYGVRKFLIICSSCDDQICNTVNEGKQLNVKCPSSQEIYIGSALYGKEDIGCSASTSLSKVKAFCQGKNSCNVPANNHVFGDPCYGVKKFLTICSSCVGQ